MVKQTLVDMADLFNIEGTERDPTSLGGATVAQLHPQHLERLQQVQHDTVGDQQRSSLTQRRLSLAQRRKDAKIGTI